VNVIDDVDEDVNGRYSLAALVVVVRSVTGLPERNRPSLSCNLGKRAAMNAVSVRRAVTGVNTGEVSQVKSI
jgi:hypothetical protein